jgi:multiple sugar transport system substrate-binding protein
MSLVGGSLGAANAPEYFLDLVVANGGAFLNEDGTEAAFNSPEGEEALEFLVELMSHSADGQVNRAWDESAQLMANGVTASDIVLSSVASTAASGAAEGKVAFTPLVPSDTTSSFMNTWGLLVPKASQNPEGAFLLMQFLLNKENVKGMAEGGGGSVVPARTSLLDELATTFPSFEAQKVAAENGTFWPKITTLDAARTAVATFVQQAVLGSLSVSEALDQAEDAVNAALNP